jgi:arylsulfatase A-like enzyme
VASLNSNAQSNPNIIVFMVDDMGWQDCSVFFGNKKNPSNSFYETPNMERMAAMGMKFTNAYSTPVCTPTRVSLMTGMNAARHRVTMWTNVQKDVPTDAKDNSLTPPSWNYNGFDPTGRTNNTIQAIPLPQLLVNQGYYTVHVGKAHFGSTGTPGADPKNLGFQVNVAGTAAGHPASYFGEKNYGNPADGRSTTHGVQGLSAYHGTNVFLTDALTREALKAIQLPIEKKQPFFLYLAHYAVHVPLDADKRFLNKYLAKGLDTLEAKYASLIEGMDKSLGEVMDYLKQKNIEQNTLVVFMTDNGGLSLAPPRGGAKHTHNLPLRAGKGSVYEGGIRVPMMVSWPGKIKPGSTNSNTIIIEDFFPTLLDVAGGEKQRLKDQMDGQSFYASLFSKVPNNKQRLFVWHVPNKWTSNDGPGINFFSAARQGDWKIVKSLRTEVTELYNLKKDIGETNDLTEKYPQRATQMKLLLENALKASNAQMPTKN